MIERFSVNPDHIFLEKAKKKYLIEAYERGIEKRQHISFCTYEDAVILPVSPMVRNGRACGKTGVLRSDGTYVEESYVDSLFGGGYLPKSCQVSEKRAAYLGCDQNAWGHFLVNVVPRVWIALEHDEEIDEYVIVRDIWSSSLMLSDNQAAFFEYLGILDKVRVQNIPVRYSKVIVPKASYRARKYMDGTWERGFYYDEYVQVFKLVSERALKEYKVRPACIPQKVFFSRPIGFGIHKKDTGVELTDSFFRNNGYTVIYPETRSLAEMIYLLHHCESVAYLSGTLQHNMLFASEHREAIAVERRIILSINQTDIDLIKKIRAVYVSAQYTILPGNRAFSSIYAYTFLFREFAKDRKLKPPDSCYTNNWYLKKCIREFLRAHCWTRSWEDKLPSPYHEFYFEVLWENFGEVGERIPEIGRVEKEHVREAAFWKEKFQELLREYQIPYSRWREDNLREFIKTISSLIEINLEKGRKEFLIYPYGINGLMIENILQQRYGMAPLAVFDEKMWKYNEKVKKTEEMQKYLTEKACVILTTCSQECQRVLEQYVPKDRIAGPYTVF